VENWLFHTLLGVLLIMPWQSQKGLRLLDEQVLVDRGARMLFYRSAIAGQWILATIAVVALWRRDPGYVPGLFDPQVDSDALFVLALGSLALLSQCPLIPWVHRRMRRWASARRALHAMRNILPRSAQEKRMWVHVALTAGICEEILFRGFLIYYAQSILGLEIVGAVAFSSAIFAICHYYQGTSNMLRVGIVGAILGTIMVMTQSLVFCIALHAVLDLGALRMGDIVAPDDVGSTTGNMDDL
jgi:membrane protease YdiL (CAAX protease family)